MISNNDEKATAQIKTEVVPVQIIDLAAEAMSEYNDGWAKQGYRQKLTLTRDYIDRILSKKVGER